LVKEIAKRKALMDIPNDRSSHTIPTPRGGGIAIAVTWFAGISFMYYQYNINQYLYFALMSGLLISTISFLDDIINLKSLPRLIIQAVATGIAIFFIGGLKKIDLGFYIIENQFLLTLIAFVGIIWFINLFNFIDGIDGYAGSESIFVALSLLAFTGDYVLLLLTVAVLGFLPWNWDKAKIFMGDVGSTLIGFTLAILAVYYQNTDQFPIFNWLILTSLFWFDATLTLFRRFRNKEKLSQAHRKHAYQRIVQAGFSHQKTVLYAIAINVVLFVLVLINHQITSLLLPCFFITLTILWFINHRIDRKKNFV